MRVAVHDRGRATAPVAFVPDSGVLACRCPALAAESRAAAEFDTEAKEKNRGKGVGSAGVEPVFSQAVHVELDPGTLAFCDHDDEVDFVRLCG